MKTVAQTVIEADHFYTIAAHTGNVIQAVEGTKEAGTVRLGKYEHKPEQEWSFIRVGDGVYRIRNRASGKLLDLTMTGTANGTWLHLWEDVGGTSQMWTVQPTPEGTVRLRSSWAGGKCVDTVGMGAAVGTVLQIWQEVSGADDQLWTIAEVKERAKRAAKKAEAPAVELPLKLHPLQKRHRPRRLRPASPAPPKRRLPPRQKLQKRGRQRPQHRQKSPQSLPVKLPQKRPPPRLPKKQSLQRQKYLQRKSPLRRSPSASAHPARRRRRSDLVLLTC